VAPDTILDQTVTVRFDASVDRTCPGASSPWQRDDELRIGETGLAFYEALQPDRPPGHRGHGQLQRPRHRGGLYFTKIECFCFTEQVLQPGETGEMPVSFFVDPPSSTTRREVCA
jgi:cytochrome c oxidase assembly protein subunit 11